MGELWSATSLVSLTLLGCLVGTEVEAQHFFNSAQMPRTNQPQPDLGSEEQWFPPGYPPEPPLQAAHNAPPLFPYPGAAKVPPLPQKPSKPQDPQLPFHPSPPKVPTSPYWPPKPYPPNVPPSPHFPPNPNPPNVPPPNLPPPNVPTSPHWPPKPHPPNVPIPPQRPPKVQPVPNIPILPQKPQVTATLPPMTPSQGHPNVPPPVVAHWPPNQLPPNVPISPQWPPNLPSHLHWPTHRPPRIPTFPHKPKGPTTLPATVPPKLPQQPQKPTLPQVPVTFPPPATQHPIQSCDVAHGQRVPCGLAGITAAACNAISCCFDGHQCYYGTAVTVQCTKDAQFIVVIAKDATLPKIDLQSISLLGNSQGCTSVDSNSKFAIYQFPVTACGTTVTEQPGVIIYENRMSSSYEVGVGPLGAITRDSYYQLIFQCRYIGTSVKSVVAQVLPLQDPPLPVAALGPITVELRLANGQCQTKGCNELDVAYNSFYTNYPVTKVLRDPVYVEVHLTGKTDPNLILTLGHCWTTTSPTPHSLPQWDILVYIHCSTAVCTAAPGSSCEPSCGRKKRDAKAADKKNTEPKVVASIGPVIMGVPEQQTAQKVKLNNLVENIR
ncbi:Zona pellucida sperm-binding protein 4 Zona pellucida glycoprotein 4 [Channa argus]|uniref:Zona pellucida sperm-binding protein 4 n=1 Tax=Channa argus TaxID=215402 RepID=A0A6G1PG03_CHAAH|nr:Zona pellucida sperm-binding protein 4 Zona pellucida glycoprotein 4 [Channa argus]